jgi:hypothetical protein
MAELSEAAENLQQGKGRIFSIWGLPVRKKADLIPIFE